MISIVGRVRKKVSTRVIVTIESRKRPARRVKDNLITVLVDLNWTTPTK